MSFPLIIILYVYFFFLAVFLLFSFFNIYHLFRFTHRSLGIYFIAFFYILVSCAIIGITSFYLLGVDWSQNFNLIPSSIPAP